MSIGNCNVAPSRAPYSAQQTLALAEAARIIKAQLRHGSPDRTTALELAAMAARGGGVTLGDFLHLAEAILGPLLDRPYAARVWLELP